MKKQSFFIVVLTMIASLFYVVPTAMAGTFPISNMPVYNGTYYGTPSTGGDCDSAATNCDSTAGRKMFSVLYRDNYNRTSGCAGERCGKHPGVDIAVVSGTPVKASMSGTAYRVDSCNSTWGGLVVIEVNNPYSPGEKAYISYAHMRSVFITQGSSITEGQTIGQSGGSTSDACHGESTGSHLHFQVDRPHTGLYPWYPLGRVEDTDDLTNPEVPQYTHNPLPFVAGYAYYYTFSENNNKELWGATNVTNYNVVNSYLWVDSSSPYTYTGRSSLLGDASCGDTAPCSREITLDANIFKYLVMELDFKCVSNPVTIYFRKPGSSWYAASFSYDTARVYNLYMGGLSSWNGIITNVMINPSQGCTANPGPEEYLIKQMYFY